MTLLYVPLVTCAAMLLYVIITFNVGRARMRYGVKPPATSGDEDFLRYFRTQQNTLEQMMLFLPSLWLCGWFVSDIIAASLGAVWVFGRIWYALGYYSNSPKRMPGFLISLLASNILLLGAIYGIVTTWM